MKDILAWLRQTGIKTEDTAFKKAVTTPFMVFIDTQNVSGHDTKNCIIDHDLTVEYYDSSINRKNEEKIEVLFNNAGLEYKKDRQWLDSEKVFMTVYYTGFTERMENNG